MKKTKERVESMPAKRQYRKRKRDSDDDSEDDDSRHTLDSTANDASWTAEQKHPPVRVEPKHRSENQNDRRNRRDRERQHQRSYCHSHTDRTGKRHDRDNREGIGYQSGSTSSLRHGQQKPLCQEFMNGYCADGNNCKLLHSEVIANIR